MSQVGRWLQHPPKGSRRGDLHGPVRGRFVGMSQAVCLFPVPTSFAVEADWRMSRARRSFSAT
eukprot:623410-Pyramimonas_sp.AAC.1